jgi:hypothetical protein
VDVDGSDNQLPEPDEDDALLVEGNGGDHAEPRDIHRFKKSATGSLIAAGLFGVRDALEGRPEREQVTIVTDAPDRPVEQSFSLVFDEDDPTKVKVVLPPRPPEER